MATLKKQPTDDPPRRPKGRPKGTRPPVKPVYALKGIPAFGDWLRDFAAAEGLEVADLIVEAITDRAKRKKFRPPPSRTGEPPP